MSFQFTLRLRPQRCYLKTSSSGLMQLPTSTLVAPTPEATELAGAKTAANGGYSLAELDGMAKAFEQTWVIAFPNCKVESISVSEQYLQLAFSVPGFLQGNHKGWVQKHFGKGAVRAVLSYAVDLPEEFMDLAIQLGIRKYLSFDIHWDAPMKLLLSEVETFVSVSKRQYKLFIGTEIIDLALEKIGTPIKPRKSQKR